MNLQQTGTPHQLTAEQISQITVHMKDVQGFAPDEWRDHLLYVPNTDTSGTLFVEPATWNPRVGSAKAALGIE